MLPAVSLADMLEPSAWLAKVPVIRLEAWMLSMMVKVLPTARPAGAQVDRERQAAVLEQVGRAGVGVGAARLLQEHGGGCAGGVASLAGATES